MTKKTREKIFRGERMKEAREGLGYTTRQQYAEVSGIDERQIKRYENGEAEPMGIIIRVLTETLNVSSDWLYGLTDDPRKRDTDAEYIPNVRDLALLNAAERNDLNEIARILAERNTPKKRKEARTPKHDPKVESSSS
jgi:transcriptional regulator with XRE-family HTH domain